MRIKVLILTYIFLFFGAGSVFALDAPIQLTPSDNATVTSSKLEWQTPSYQIYTQGSPYVVQIKNAPTFSSQDDRYKTNTYYTPQLSDGIWYWRVKAKNSDGIWSDWSTTWSFNLTTSTPSPLPDPTPTPFPSPTSSPTPTSSGSTTSLFTVSNTPSQINSDQSFNTSVNLSLPNNPDTTYYLAGAFKIVGGTRYFGLTKTDSGWTEYSSENFSSQYKIITNSLGTWSGNLEIKPNVADSDYKGTGDYVFKLARYTQTGSQTWSSESNIKIISTEIEVQSDTSTSNTPSPTINPSTSPQSVPNKNTSLSQTSKKIYYKVASIAGVTRTATPSAIPSTITVKSQKQTNPLVWIGLIFIFAGAGLIGYIYLKKNAKIHI